MDLPVTETVRVAVLIAREEAKHAHVDFVGVAHLLIGMLKASPLLRAHCRRRNLEPRILRAVVRSRLGQGTEKDGATPALVERLTKLLERATARAKSGEPASELEVLIALGEERTGVVADLVQKLDLSADSLAEVAGEAAPESNRPSREPAPAKQASTPMLDRIAHDLVAKAKAKTLSAFVGRKETVKRVIVALARHSKPNVVLVGEAGVGKTAIVEGLAHRVAEGNVPPAFANMRLLAIEPSSLAAGASLVGEIEKRLRQLVEEASSDPNIVLFIDELHSLMGVGHGPMSAGDILKPALARGEIRVIGATTNTEFARWVERDAAIARRFEKIEVSEPTAEEALEILRGLRDGLQDHHDVTITDEALAAAVSLSTRYLTDRRLPDKAIDLVDEACSRARLATMNVGAGPRSIAVTHHAIAAVVAERAGVPLEELTSMDRQNLLDLEARLAERVIGQNAAVAAIARAIQTARVGLKAPGRPVGAFLLSGPSGVGKTALAEAVAELAFGRGAFVRIDLSEYQQAHELSRLVGAPPGYVGHDREGVLTSALKRRPHSVVLFDEADKASSAVFDLLLQVIDEGTLTDGRGTKIDCSQCLILLASNHLAPEGARRAVGFGAHRDEPKPDAQADRGELKKFFREEFLGRLDAVLRFEPLSEATLREVAAKLLRAAVERLERLRVAVTIDDSVVPLLARSGNASFGARPIRARLESDVLGPAGEILLRKGPEVKMTVTTEDGRIVVREQARDE